MRNVGYALVAGVALVVAWVLIGTGTKPTSDHGSDEGLYRISSASAGACTTNARLDSPPAFVALRLRGDLLEGQSCSARESCMSWARGDVPSRPEVGDWSALNPAALAGLPWQARATERGSESSGAFSGVSLATSADASGTCSVHGIRTSVTMTPSGAKLVRTFERARWTNGECPEVPDACVFELRLTLTPDSAPF